MATAPKRSRASPKKTPSRAKGKPASVRAPTKPKARKRAGKKTLAIGPSRIGQIALLFAIMSMAFATMALVSYNKSDPGLFKSHDGQVFNAAGPVGAWVADLLLYIFGYGSCAVVLMMVVFGLKLAGRQVGGVVRVTSGLVLLWTLVCGLSLMFPGIQGSESFARGGLLGETTTQVLLGLAGTGGAWLITIAVFLSSLTFLVQVNWQRLAEAFFQRLEVMVPSLGKLGLRLSRRTMGSMVTAGSAVVDKVKQVQWVEEYEVEYMEAPSVSSNEIEPAFQTIPNGAAVSAKPEVDGPLEVPLAPARLEDFPLSFPGALIAEVPRVAPIQESGTFADRVDDQTKIAARSLVEVEWEATASGVDESSSVNSVKAGTPPKGESIVGPIGSVPVRARSVACGTVDEEPDFPFPMDLTSSGALVPGISAPSPGVRQAETGAETPETWIEEPQAIDTSAVDKVALQVEVANPSLIRSVEEGDGPRLSPAPVEVPRGVRVLPGALESGGKLDDGRVLISRPENTVFELPHMGLLDEHRKTIADVDELELHALGVRLEEKLANFGVKGEVTAIRPGPVITTFEYLPAPGIKLSKIAGLSDDIAMALRALRVRIVAPIPGKGVVGFEVPNKKRQTVWIRDMLASDAFRRSTDGLPLALGKNVEGSTEVANLAKMPHLLVAGTTGSGKSVGINSMLLSMLFTRTPEDLRMILIDPKMLEFEPYQDIPHLLHPVVTDPRLASAALKWACVEMDNRYRLLARWKTRDISSYNSLVEAELKDWTPAKARKYAPRDWPSNEIPPPPTKLPFIVIVIDELADLMMAAAKDVEVSIARLAGKARAAGMHLIVATQRPEKNVVTGLIKANLPSRIAFQVRSKLDGRIILDQSGAEALLGKGDMLFLPPGVADLVRIHGPFVSDDEVRAVTDFLREQGMPDYEAEIRIEDEDGADLGQEDYDELYDMAVAFVTKKGRASTSMVQREFKIGYNRAARIVETMEREGVVGPADGARPREVLVGAC